MKKYTYWFNVFVLVVAAGSLPSVAFANADRIDYGATAHISVQSQNAGQAEKMQSAAGDDDMDLEDMDDQDFNDEHLKADFGFEDEEGDDMPVASFNDLKKNIEVRKHELESDVASTSPEQRGAIENANPVRLAVHTLLASKDLLGGIGPEVSKIAKEMNSSVATTTNAEMKMRSRGFFSKLFFGGDSSSADAILKEVSENQARIDSLTKMLQNANVSTDVRSALQAQITAVQDAQARLEELAQKERDQWGIFSWRF